MFLISCGKDDYNHTIIEDPFTPEVEIINNVAYAMIAKPAGASSLECIEFVFPFKLVLESGEIADLTTLGDLDILIADSTNVFADFVYPLNIKIDGQLLEIKNLIEFAEAYSSCIPDFEWGENNFPAYVIDKDNSCFELVYPLIIKDEVGELTNINDAKQFSALLTDVSKYYFFSWPIKLKDEDGVIIEIASFEELSYQLIACNNIPIDSIHSNLIACLEIVFPLSINTINGSINVSTVEEYYKLLFSGNVIDFNFPINLRNLDGKNFKVEDENQLDNLILAECVVFPEPNLIERLIFNSTDFSSDNTCYYLNFPIRTVTDSLQLNHNNLNELLNNINVFPNMNLLYPVSVKESPGLELKTFFDDSALSLFIEKCE